MTTLGFAFGPWEIGLIIVVLILLFGSTRLPKLGRSVGKTIVEFKQGMTEARSITGNGGMNKPFDHVEGHNENASSEKLLDPQKQVDCQDLPKA